MIYTNLAWNFTKLKNLLDMKEYILTEIYFPMYNLSLVD